MQLYCDRCNEGVDHPINITSDGQLADIARDLGYRNVCGGCYDDLLGEAREAREHQADDRRGDHRVAAQITFRVTPSGSATAFETISDDISDNGVRLRTASPLELGLVVNIESAGGEVEALAIVEVVWNDADGAHTGLRLVEASDSWLQLVRDVEARSGPKSQ